MATLGASAAPRIERADDRRTTFGGLLIAACFLLLALGSVVLGLVGGSGTYWAALHLVLAGAAGTAVASVMPFFSAALARVAPGARGLRIGAIALVSSGALTVTVGWSAGLTWLAAAGGCAYLAGLALTAAAAFLPLRAMLGRPPRLVMAAYAAALVEVAVGVTLATSFVAGWAPVAGDWEAVKPAHAWLNLFGFLSVVVAATLLHLAPTVAGTRIRSRASGSVAVVALAVGAPLIAIGFVGGWDSVARIGAAIELVGAAALVAHAVAVHRDRGRWTTDAGWHAFTSLSLLAAPGWFVLAVAIAAGRVLWLGASPVAWSITLVGVPFVLGWAAQGLIGSWTHIVPAIGPGDQVAHAAQRRRLGRAGMARAVAWNLGVALLTIGVLAGSSPVVAAAAAGIAACLIVALILLAGSIRRSALAPAVSRTSTTR
jgi:nitrite reductase (NO-forming)